MTIRDRDVSVDGDAKRLSKRIGRCGKEQTGKSRNSSCLLCTKEPLEEIWILSNNTIYFQRGEQREDVLLCVLISE